MTTLEEHEMLKAVRLRITDPGSFLPREIINGRDPAMSAPESVANWGARAIVATVFTTRRAGAPADVNTWAALAQRLRTAERGSNV